MKTLEAVPAAPPPTTMPRLHFIDGLRGTAMLMVLLGYLFHRLFERPFMNALRAARPA